MEEFFFADKYSLSYYFEGFYTSQVVIAGSLPSTVCFFLVCETLSRLNHQNPSAIPDIVSISSSFQWCFRFFFVMWTHSMDSFETFLI